MHQYTGACLCMPTSNPGSLVGSDNVETLSHEIQGEGGFGPIVPANFPYLPSLTPFSLPHISRCIAKSLLPPANNIETCDAAPKK